jgi:hypothetical protein
MKKLVCDKGCSGEFILLEPGVLPIWDDIEDIGFNCPHCDHRYTLHYSNDELKKLQAEQQKLLQRSDPRKLSKRQLQGVMSLVESKKRRIAQVLNELKIKVNKG